MKKCEEEIIIAIKATVQDMEKIKHLKSPFVAEMIENYLNGSSFEACIAKNEELINAAQKAGASVIGSASQAVAAQEIADKAGTNEGVTVMIKGTKLQLEQLFDFMKIMGIDHEIL